MSQIHPPARVHAPASLREATSMLADFGRAGAPLAGATWIMRHRAAPVTEYVTLRGVPGLRDVDAAADRLRLGAMLTHAELACRDEPALAGLARAAAHSAFPAVRSVATLGGNLCSPFAEADLVPPLLAADAVLELASGDMDLATWIRGERPTGALVIAVRVPAPAGCRTAFERLTVRHGAEYSLASVAVSIDVAADGTIAAARVVVGAVEPRPVRVAAAEEVLIGERPGEALGRRAGEAAAEVLDARDALDAPGWYRRAVLPALAGRAVAQLEASA